MNKSTTNDAGNGKAAGVPNDLPSIRVMPGAMDEALAAAELVLSKTGDYYTRGDRIVNVRFDQLTRRHQIREMSGQDLVVAFTSLSKWSRFDKRIGDWTDIDPSPQICRILAQSFKHGRLPVLNGTVTQPYIRADSTVCSVPGYDPETGILGLFTADTLNISRYPNRNDAEQALLLLDDLISECTFATAADRSAALSALLTAVIRPSIPLAPMFHVMAHKPGSGKSYLCQLITALATDTAGTPVPFPRSNDACDKLLLSQLMNRPAVIEFDNLSTNLRPFDNLCSALTSEYLEGRQLGRSQTVVVPTKTLFLSSGNNVRPIGDMVRRCITINLDPGMEAPVTRVYKRPALLDEVREERTKYICAALTIVRAWVLAGQPHAACPSLASYSKWSDWCRQPLLWLGRPDPADSVFKRLNEDSSHSVPSRNPLDSHEKQGNALKSIRDKTAAIRSEEIDEALDALAEAGGKNVSTDIKTLKHRLAHNDRTIATPNGRHKYRKPRHMENRGVIVSDVLIATVRHRTVTI